MFIYYHNPRCSKSREGLKLLQSKRVHFTIKEYLKDPLTVEEVKTICHKLDKSPLEIVRQKEDIFKTLDPRGNWYQAIVEHPILLERPILVTEDKAVIGRPPEDLLKIL